MEKIEKKFSTSDLGLSAALISRGFRLSSIDKNDPRRVVFLFAERLPQINPIVETYWSGELVVSARIYFESIKMLKNRIYNS